MTPSETNIIDRLASPESLLGMLQRGRGAGYLAALDTPRETLWPLLFECVTNDPRFDQDCEDRSEYYASLTLATGMDVTPLHSHLRQNAGRETLWEMRPCLPLETFMDLAERGSQAAVQTLRDYITLGDDWARVVISLYDVGEWTLDGIGEVLRHRITSDPSLHSLFKETLEDHWKRFCDLDAERRHQCWLLLPICEPWKTLCDGSKAFADLFAEVGIAYLQPPPAKMRPTPESLATLSIDEIFARVEKSNYVAFCRVLLERVSMQDEGFLLQNLSSDNKYRVILAFRGLGRLGTPKASEATKAYIEASENDDKIVRGSVIDALAEMPGYLTLGTARQWFRRKEHHFHFPAGQILENHATLEDVPLLIEALRTPETVRCGDFRLAGALNALARFEGIGPIPELEQIFRQVPDCFDRYRAANTMAVTAPAQFRNQYALECLWDCHWDTRILGCEMVSLSTPGAPERLKEIANDACESDSVRQAARERFRGL